MNGLISILVVLFTYLLAILFALIHILRPQDMVRRQAQFYRRRYVDSLKLTDEEIDKKVSRFWFFFLIDSVSHFVNRGPDHPEEFARLLTYYRVLGCLILVIVTIVILFFLWAIVSGRLIIG